MVLRFTAKVKKREVRVRDVDLPDGSTVDVTIAPQEDDDDFDLTPEQWAKVREAEREIDRGEFIPGDEFIAWLRELELHGSRRPDGKPNTLPRGGRVGASPRRRAKSAARRVSRKD